jgi:hypothetical protein
MISISGSRFSPSFYPRYENGFWWGGRGLVELMSVLIKPQCGDNGKVKLLSDF